MARKMKLELSDPTTVIHIDTASINYVSGWIIASTQSKDQLSVELVTPGFKSQTGLICTIREDVPTAENQICLGFVIHVDPTQHQIGESSDVSVNDGEKISLKSLKQFEVDQNFMELIVNIEEMTSTRVTGWIGFLRVSARGRNLYILSDNSKELIRITDRRIDVSASTGIAECFGFRSNGVRGKSVSVVDSHGATYLKYRSDRLSDGATERSTPIAVSAFSSGACFSQAHDTAADLLSQFRIDSNYEFVFMADPKFEIPIRTQLRSDPSLLFHLGKEGNQIFLDDDNFAKNYQLLLRDDFENSPFSPEYDSVALRWKNSDGTECELTNAQTIYARSQKCISLFTDNDYATLLTSYVTNVCRGIIGGIGLLTNSQLRFLNELHPLGRQSKFQLNRYQISRRVNSPELGGAREQFDFVSQATLFVNTFVDEIFNGFGNLLINDNSIKTNAHLAAYIREFCFLAGRISESKLGSEYLKVAEKLLVNDYNRWFGQLSEAHFLRMFSLSESYGGLDELIDEHSVGIIGTVGHASGVGRNADNSITAVQKNGLRAKPLTLNVNSDAFSFGILSSKFPQATNYIVHLQPDLFSTFIRFFPRPAGIRKLIGFFAWETQNVPTEFSKYFHLLDEIWTPSEFSAAAFRRCFPGTVNVVPHAVIPCNGSGRISRDSLGIPKEKFVFFYSFDAHSTIYRKNPLAIIKAVDQLNGQGLWPLVLLKIRNFEQLLRELEQGSRFALDFLESLRSRTDVVLITHELDFSECQDLMDLSDAYISLHRSEGFGYTMAEAMASNKPTIATGFSGNLQFMSNNNSFLVNFRTVEINGDAYPWSSKGDFWAEPDIEHATEVMRLVMLGGHEVSERSSQGCADVLERFSLNAMAAIYEKHLNS